MRVSEDTRERVNELVDELGESSADAVVQRLLREHWWNEAIKEAHEYFDAHPEEADAERAELNAWTDGDTVIE